MVPFMKMIPVLTESQLKGKSKLLKRQTSGELVLCRTDKSGKLCVLSKDLFIRKIMPHIGDDVVVSWEDVKNSEKVLNASCAQVTRVLRMGCDNQHEDRIKAAVTVTNSSPWAAYERSQG